MTYEIYSSGLRPMPSRWPILDVLRARHPYTVLRGTRPGGTVVGVASTMRGAHKLIEHDKRQPARREPLTFERVA